MMTNDNDWGFYGRKKEIDLWMKYLSTTGFNATAVIGGRGVGKTELIKKVLKQFIENPPQKIKLSTLNLQLQVPNIIYKHGREVYEQQAEILCDALRAQAREQNIADLLPEYDDSSFGRKVRFFYLSVKKILARGGTVFLDEFQNIEQLGLETYFMGMIDELESNSNGKLVVAGSHQQGLIKLILNNRRPLYQRFGRGRRIYPLSAPDLFDMAVKRGWMQYPKQFLTCYAAFGGIPRYWRRLADAQRFEGFPEIGQLNDQDWQEEFVKYNWDRLQAPNESFFQSDFMDLSEDAQIILDLLQNSRGSRLGVCRWSRVIQAFQKKGKTSKHADHAAYVLRSHLGIVGFTPNPFPERNKHQIKIRLIEPAAKFELMIKKDLDALAKENAASGAVPEKIINLMNSLEGFGLERLTAEWLKNFNDIKYVNHSLVWEMLPDQTGNRKSAELDVVGDGKRFGDPSHRPLVICSCKRNASAHQVHNTHVAIEDYIRRRFEDEKERRPLNMIQRVLISPLWTAETDKEPQKDGFYRFDLRDMEAATQQENAPFPILETAPQPGPKPGYSDDGPEF